MSRQQCFQGSQFLAKHSFGGSLLKGNARSARPLSSKLPIHLVLRADVKGKTSMRNPRCYVSVNQTVSRLTRKYGFTLYKYANVGNHLHLLLRIGNRRLWARFIRELTGRIAQEVQGLRGRQRGASFWLNRPFTRVVTGWGNAFRSVRDYVTFNQWEAEGYISRKDFKTLKQLRQFWEFA